MRADERLWELLQRLFGPPMLLLAGAIAAIAFILWRARDKARVAAPMYWIGVLCVAFVWITAILRLESCFALPIAAVLTLVFMNLIPYVRSRRL